MRLSVLYCRTVNFTVSSPSSSEKVTGKIKSKWVNAFKNVKGKQSPAVGPAKPPVPAAPVLHWFQLVRST